jgi:hypothetical protein
MDISKWSLMLAQPASGEWPPLRTANCDSVNLATRIASASPSTSSGEKIQAGDLYAVADLIPKRVDV